MTPGAAGVVVDTDVTDGSGLFQLNPGSSTAGAFSVQVLPGTWQGGWVGTDDGGSPQEFVQPALRYADPYAPGDHIGNIWANPAYIRGVVVDAATGNPVSGIYVTARDSADDLAVEGSDTTDSRGVFRVTGITCEDSCYLKLNGTGRGYEVGFRSCGGGVVATWGEACASPIGRIGKVRLDHLWAVHAHCTKSPAARRTGLSRSERRSRSEPSRVPTPKSAETRSAVARSTRVRPSGVISARTARPSVGCFTRRTKPWVSSRSTIEVTDVGCTWRRSPILPSGSEPRREKVSSTSAS